MATFQAMQRAAQAWCTPETEGIDMDVRLAEAFAEILDEACGGTYILPENACPAQEGI